MRAPPCATGRQGGALMKHLLVGQWRVRASTAGIARQGPQSPLTDPQMLHESAALPAGRATHQNGFVGMGHSFISDCTIRFGDCKQSFVRTEKCDDSEGMLTNQSCADRAARDKNGAESAILPNRYWSAWLKP